ncbi:hypothetical protein F5X99DRAFT_276227 [Biscogniauxia marginata]|nr:hypothetical protein F5X99DRAFT_276227 [Biscogniauxia marginata]
MDKDGVCVEVILSLVGRMDLETMKSFMVVNKNIQDIVRDNEITISAYQAQQFLVPPTGRVLSSGYVRRRELPSPSWALVSEMELRDSRIDDTLTRHPEFINLDSLPGMGPLIPEQKRRLLPLLRRAMCQCDAIADIAANVPWTPMNQATPEMDTRSLWALAAQQGDQQIIEEVDPYRKLHARPKQIEYIKALQLDDVAVLLFLANIGGVSWARKKNLSNARAGGREQTIMFEEIVLRHGTWLIWVFCNEGTQTLLNEIVGAGMMELADWENGEAYTLPGIKMTLMQQFKKLIKITDNVGDEGNVGAGDSIGAEENVGDEGSDAAMPLPLIVQVRRFVKELISV